jgi:hypothetical protein
MMVVVSVSFAEQNAILSEPKTTVPDQFAADTSSQKKEATDTGQSADKPSPLSAHKINYFTANRIPMDSEAQIK